MPRPSNLYGVPLPSRGNVNNGRLSTQPITNVVRTPGLRPSDKTGHLARQIQQSSATANTATEPCGNPPTLTLNLIPVPRLTFPEDQEQQAFGECGPDLRSMPQNTCLGIFPVTVPNVSEPLSADRQNDSKDISDKKISTNGFKPILDSGVGTSPFRPELIMVTDYLPLYQRGKSLELSDTGLFVDVMFQAHQLRQETLAKIILKIQQKNLRTEADDKFKLVVEKYDKTIAKLEKDLGVASDIQKKISEVRKILDVRQAIDIEYDSKYFLSINDFVTQNMQYSKNQTRAFSNTKLLSQLLFDFRSTLQNYSVGLLDLRDPDRATDTSPINLDKTYTISNGFTFNLDSLAANQKDINATDVVFVNSFLSSLPTKKQEVIKVLSVLLCKELLVSKGLGNQEIKNKIANITNTRNNQNIFQKIIGDVGSSIFEINSTPGTLFSLLVRDVPNNPNIKVLPFENKYFDAENNKNIFVPGSSYYADSIFDIEAETPSWNVKPIIDYVSDYVKVTDSATDLLASLLGYKSSTGLLPTELIKNIYLEMHQVLSGLVDKDRIDRDSAILSSVIKLSEKDNRLRNLLFQYAILAGMRMNGTSEESAAFKLLANELQNVSALSLVRLNSRSTDDPSNVRLADGERAIGQYIEATAVAIEKRVNNILNTLDSSAKKNKDKGQNTTNVINVKNNNPDYYVGNIRVNNITSALRRALRTRTTYSFLKSFVDNFERLIVRSQENGLNNFLSNNKTNNSGLNVSTLSLMFFELCASFYATYMGSIIEQTKDGTTLTVNVKSNNSTRSVLYELARKDVPIPTYNEIIGNVQDRTAISVPISPFFTSNTAETTEQAKKTELYNILIELSNEEKIPANVLYILQKIKSYISNNSTNTLTFFQQNKLQTYLVDNNINSDKLEALQNLSQLRVSSHILDGVKSLTPTKVTIDGNIQANAQTNKLVLTDNLTPNEYSLIKLMMSESPYLPEANYSPEKEIKLFSIGIPAGFGKQLVDRINVEDITNESFRRRQADIVDVLIYKRDLRFEDIVFKPLKFSFDMSLFLNQQAIDLLVINEKLNFTQVFRKLSLADYPFDATYGYRKKLLDYSFIVDFGLEYRASLPNKSDRIAMFKNHIVSYILDMYISLLTGLKVDETTFVQTQSKPDRSIDREVFEIVYTYVKDIVDKRLPPLPSLTSDAQISALIQEILSNTTYSQKAKDYFFLFTYGTIAFNTEYLTALINQPKIFDRVFHVPVNVSDFEVDLEATLSTESGRQAWESTYVQDRIVPTQDGFYKVKPKSTNELVFEDFFVRIETAIDKD